MEFDVNMLPLLDDPLVEEANIYDLSLKVCLSDSVLKHYFTYLQRFCRSDSEIFQHIQFVFELFPELANSGDIPHPWVWKDIVTSAKNVGNTEEAKTLSLKIQKENRKVAYWTGGLEFTKNHEQVAKYLVENDFYILLGIEPFCYPSEAGKNRGSIADDVVPMSLWSKYLGKNGFIFRVPRPLPKDELFLEHFYDGLYEQITERKASIVVSGDDKFKEDKAKRGPIVLVPHFNYPSTTQLWRSFYG